MSSVSRKPGTTDSYSFRRRNFLKAVGATGVAGLAGCTSDGDANGGDGTATPTEQPTTTPGTTTGGGTASEVVLGANFPLSGNLAYTGGLMANAVELAAMLRNEAGGIESLGGAEVRVIKGDNQAAQELGGQVTEELMDQGIHTLIGCWLSSVTLAAAQVADREGLPFVTAGSAAEAVLQDNDFNYVYRVQPTTFHFGRDWARQTPVLASQQDIDVETVGFFRPDDLFGQSIIDSARSFAEDEGLEVVAETVIEVDATNADSQATRLKGVNPDIVAPTGFTIHGTLLMNAMSDIGYRPKVISSAATSTFGDPNVMENDIGPYANGVLDVNFAINPNNERSAEIKERFSAEFNDNPLVAGAAVAFTSADLTLTAIEQAGSVDPDSINDALKATELNEHILAMPSPIRFDEQGENENAFAPIHQVQDFQPRIVWPDEFAEADLQSFGSL
ncbi:ABC transporter substrate-binding protein (plasmid) [Haloferax sp. S1W]|uniref:ABC transporter substrate-binding protein n=1 Tax=Haloferax sp. S1W TaxID=3377110 RepID=UPI0037C95DFF